jgi:hypothetical protein
MRRLVSIFLVSHMLVVSFLPKLAVGELQKSAALIEHLQQHIDAGDSNNFFEAFINHYSFQCDHSDPEHAEELPFLSSIQQGLNFVVQIPLNLPVPSLGFLSFSFAFITHCFQAICLEVMAEPPAFRK